MRPIAHKICSLFICFALTVLTALPSEGAVSMYVMNSKTAKERIKKGYFSLLYRGFGSRSKSKIGAEEALGFKFLVNMEHDSHGLRDLTAKNKKAGMNDKAALKKAKSQHEKTLMNIFNSFASLSNLYVNEKDAEKELAKQGVINPESHFIFTTPRIGVARTYGPIVLVIEEQTPRGMDLNSIAKDSKYYSLGRFLKNVSNAGFKYILADYIGDRDEYVIPSYISSNEITGMIVHAPSPVVIAGKLAVPPPPVVRVYKKYNKKGAMVIDVVDKKDKLIARLSASPSASKISPEEERSNEKLPAGVLAAWREYVKSRRSKYAK